MIQGTREVDTALYKNPLKLFRNISCPFLITSKVLRDNVNSFSCNIFVEHCHNHTVNFLEVLSFKMLSTEI